MMTDGSYMPLVTQPLTLSLLIVSALLLFWPILRGYWPARR
jgi:TctA family transporter